MKRLLGVLWVVLCCAVRAQSPIERAEYFVGSDPGEGNGVAVALGASDGVAVELSDVTIPVNQLPAGVHEVGLRVRDESGRWSRALMRRVRVNSYTIGGGIDPSDPDAGAKLGKPVVPLHRAEYFVGSDPGEGNGVAVALGANDGMAVELSDVTIPVNQLSAGVHEVGLRVRDESGRWSRAMMRRVRVNSYTIGGGVDPTDPAVASKLSKPVIPLHCAEYFVGTDPGEGNGVAVALGASDGVAVELSDVTIPVNQLSAGVHEVGLRVRDEGGRWSRALMRRVRVNSYTIGGGVDPTDPAVASKLSKPVIPLHRAEYFVGTDPGEGNGVAVALGASDGVAVELSDVTIPVNQLPAGVHEVGLRVRDESGRWSRALMRRVRVNSYTIGGGIDPSDPAVASKLSKPVIPLHRAEYFVGTDPGEGNGVAVALGANDGMAVELSEAVIPVNQLPPGTHVVGLRVRDESGRWSRALVRRMTVYRTDVVARQRDGTKLVDLEYDLPDGSRPFTAVLLISRDGGVTWDVSTASVTGDAGTAVVAGRGKRMTWHAGEDWNNSYSENMKFRVVAYETGAPVPPGYALVAPGVFAMGSPVGEPGRGADETQHSVVRNRPVLLRSTEVTWSEWNAVRSEGPKFGYADIAVGRNGHAGDDSGNHPVTEVSWLDAVKWCNLKSEIEGRRPVYHGDASLHPSTVVRMGIPVVHGLWVADGYRLPTEAEWEAACRAGAETAFTNGVISDVVGDRLLDVVGWYAGNSGGNSRAVGTRAANALGLHDLHGNVREWCWDSYALYSGGTRWDPAPAVAGGPRVVRGGSWNLAAAACRSAARGSSGANSRSSDLGFRIARNAPGLTDVSSPAGVAVDSRDPVPGNLLAGMRFHCNGPVTGMAAQADGALVVCGDFTEVNGVARRRVFRIGADGLLDEAFDPGADAVVHAVAVLGDGRILLAGDFSSVANGPADYVARLFPDGALDVAFQPGLDGAVHCVAVQADGRILLGGEFSSVAGVGRSRLARLTASGGLDEGFGVGADGLVKTMAVQVDGKVLLGGEFALVGTEARSGLARLWPDGSVDGAFQTGVDGSVASLLVQSDGRILVGGMFGKIGGVDRPWLARVTSAGGVDSLYQPGLDGPVHSLVQQANGTVFAGGEFGRAGGQVRKGMVALQANGALVSDFALEFDGPVLAIGLLPGGRVVAGGDFTSVSGVVRWGLAVMLNGVATQTLAAMSGTRVRWLRGGTAPDAAQVAFEISTDGGSNWLNLGAGSRVSGGWERTGVNLPSSGLLRAKAFSPSGRGGGSSTLTMASVSFAGLVTVPEITVLSGAGVEIVDGGEVPVGQATMGSFQDVRLKIRNDGYGALTGLGVTFAGVNSGDFAVLTPPVAPVAGPGGTTELVIRFTPADAGLRQAILRIANNDLNENPYDLLLSGTGVVPGQLAGGVDPAFGGNVNALAVQSDGRIVAGGRFLTAGELPRVRLARLRSDLSVDPADAFGTGGSANGEVMTLAVQPDGKILAGGLFTTVNSQSRNRIARFLADGTLEATSTFAVGTGANNAVNALVVQPDGRILIGGNFTQVAGQSRIRVARLMPDGTVDASFLPGLGADGLVHTMALQPDGRILIGGVFQKYGGVDRPRLARLMADGSIDSSFVVSADGKVSSLAVQPDGRIVAGGMFTSVNGVDCGRLVRLRSDGTVEGRTEFDPGSGADGEVTTLALQSDGGILLGGAFGAVNEEVRAGIARLYPNGTLENESTFDTVFGADAAVRSLTIRADGSVLAGGDFTDYNGVPRGRMAVLANQPTVDRLVVLGSSEIEWQRGGTAPVIGSPRFELSLDGLGGWTPLAVPVAGERGWVASGLRLPSSGVVRASGYVIGGLGNASSGRIRVMSDYVNAPLVTTLGATDVTLAAAVLNGEIVPNGEARVRFEYGVTPSLGSFTSEQVFSGNEVFPVVFPLNGIAGTYFYRLVAQTTGGTYYGAVESFTTLPDPPVVVTGNPSGLTGNGATLVGAVNPRGLASRVHFEYGATTLYGNVTPQQNLAAGNEVVEIRVPVSGLVGGATYHYRLVAVSSAGTSFGSDVSFVSGTPGEPVAAPSVGTEGVVNVTIGGATLLATVNPNGGFANAFFEYGTTAALGTVTPALGAGNGSVPVNLFWTLGSLSPGTLYHYRIVASSSAGTTRGSIRTFTTAYLPAEVATEGALPLTTISARVLGTVQGSGDRATVFFDYGTDGVNFPNSVQAVPGYVDLTEPVEVSAELTNLEGGAVYHYRVRAVNSGGTAVGEAKSFRPAVLSGLGRTIPSPLLKEKISGELTVSFSPSNAAFGWRLEGEREWRASGERLSGMASGKYMIESKPVPGYLHPMPETVTLADEAKVSIERQYYDAPDEGVGSLVVVLKPDSLNAGSLPDAQRAKWRIQGGSDPAWRDSGEAQGGLPPGIYLIECRPVSGLVAPTGAAVEVMDSGTSLVTLAYTLENPSSGQSAVKVEFSEVTGEEAGSGVAWMVGQIRSAVGLGTGFVVRPRVVATAAHVVWDEGALAPVAGLQWLFQRHKGSHEPMPQVPRGFYVFDGYAAARGAPGVVPGEGTPASQNLDVAAMYFLEDAGRGGYAGFLASDLPANEFLTSGVAKRMVGYPVDGIAVEFRGMVHATPEITSPLQLSSGRTYVSGLIRSSGGASGAPLCVRHASGYFYPAAIYLGGSGQSVFRAFDSSVADLFSRAEVSGNGGENNTGGGITHTGTRTIGGATSPGGIKVTLEPAGAASAGGGWRLRPATSYRTSGSQLLNLSPGTYILQLKPVTGYELPAEQTVRISGGQELQVTFTYEALLSPLQAWRKANFGSAEATGVAADVADPDGDGLGNLVEYAFGLDPRSAGLSRVPEWVREGEFMVFSYDPPPGVAGVRVIPEMSVDLRSGSWVAVPDSGVAPTVRCRVPVLAGSGRQFFRLRVIIP